MDGEMVERGQNTEISSYKIKSRGCNAQCGSWGQSHCIANLKRLREQKFSSQEKIFSNRVWWGVLATGCADPLAIYANIESLHCIPKINIMPYQLYIRKKEKIEAKFGKLVKVTHLSNGMPETEFKSGGLKPLGLLLLKV